MSEIDPSENQENEQGGKKGGSGVLGLKDKLNNAADNTKNASEALSKGAQKATEFASKNTGRKAEKASKAAERLSKTSQQLQKASKTLSKGAQAAAKLTKLLIKGGIILLIILAVIGLIVFIIAGLGLILAGLKQIATSFLETFTNFANGTENNIRSEEILEVADYLEEMGYDLFGYGFTKLPNAVRTIESEETGTSETPENDDLDDIDAESINTTEKELVYTTDETAYAYDYITTYLISDNYAYMIKNSNKNWKNSITSSIGSFFKGFIDNTAWGSGLLSIYYQADEDTLGAAGMSRGLNGQENISNFSFLNLDGITSKWNYLTSDVKINREAKTLDIESPGWGGSTMTYSLDGWAGRYSMPLEFLLSAHVATMAPDLSYRLAKSFDTDVQILLYKSEGGTIHAGVQYADNTNSKMTLDELTKVKNQVDATISEKISNFFTGEKDQEEALEVLQETTLTSIDPESEVGKAHFDDYACHGPPGESVFDGEDLPNLRIDTLTDEDNNYLYNEISNGLVSKKDDFYNKEKEGVMNLVDQIYNTDKVSITSIGKDSVKAQIGQKFWQNIENEETSAETEQNEQTKNISIYVLEGNGLQSSKNGSVKFEIQIDNEYIELDVKDSDLVLDDSYFEDRTMNANSKTVVKAYMVALIEKLKNQINENVSYDGDIDTFAENIKDNWLTFIVGTFDYDEKLVGTISVITGGNSSEAVISDQTIKATEDKELIINATGTYDEKDVSYKIKIAIVAVTNPSQKYNSYTSYGSSRNEFLGDANSWMWIIDLERLPDPSIKLCSDDENTATKACEQCTNFVKLIFDALKEVQNKDLSTYVPYINKVTDHWFRNVYFSRYAIYEDGKQDEIIKIDEEYEDQTHERWTLYETYGVSSGEDVEYKLYIRKPTEKDGIYTYDASKDYFKIKSGSNEGKYVLCRKTDKGKGKFNLKADGITFEKSSRGEYILVVNDGDKYPECSKDEIKGIKEFRAEKKAIMENINNLWNGKASVYEIGDSDSSWKTLEQRDDMSGSIKELYDLGLQVIYSAEYDTVTQIQLLKIYF